MDMVHDRYFYYTEQSQWLPFSSLHFIGISRFSSFEVSGKIKLSYHQLNLALLIRFTECYGKIGLLDRLHNTDALFRTTIYHARHRVLFSLKSARERFPDKINTKKVDWLNSGNSRSKYFDNEINYIFNHSSNFQFKYLSFMQTYDTKIIYSSIWKANEFFLKKFKIFLHIIYMG